MSINWIDVLLSLLWASALGIVAATAFIWRMERSRRAEHEAFLREIRGEE